MSRGKVYISGPITGIDFGNRFAFSCARNALELCGYEAVDPSEVQLGDDATWTDYMRADLKLLLDCDYIYMLEGWENSRGARLRISTSMPITTCRSRWDSPTLRSASPQPSLTLRRKRNEWRNRHHDRRQFDR